jgi:hypothetical protein
MFFKAISVKGGPGTSRDAIVLNSSAVLGIYQGNRVLIIRSVLDEISMQMYNAANMISHIEVTEQVAQSLLEIK